MWIEHEAVLFIIINKLINNERRAVIIEDPVPDVPLVLLKLDDRVVECPTVPAVKLVGSRVREPSIRLPLQLHEVVTELDRSTVGSPYRLRPVSTESLRGPCRMSHSTRMDKAIDNSHYPSHVGLRETLIVQQEGPHAHEVDIPPLQERTFLRCQRPVCLIKPSSSGHISFSRAPSTADARVCIW